jgi:hypothetical protein
VAEAQRLVAGPPELDKHLAVAAEALAAITTALRDGRRS